MKQQPIISVITVCRNAEKQIEATIKSVITQTYDKYEYIIIDGASNDNTLPIINNYKNHIQIIVSQPDLGIYDAMNKGTALANGLWIIFLNAGDLFYAIDTLQKVAPYLESTTAELVYGDIMKKKHKQQFLKKGEKPHNAHRMFFCHQALFTKKELLLKYPFNLNHSMSADFAFVKKMWKLGFEFMHINETIAIFDSNGISNQQTNKGLLDNISVIKEQDSLFERILFLPRLYFKIAWNKIRRKK